MSKAWDWIKAHKAHIGAVGLAMYGYVQANPDLSEWIHGHGALRHAVGLVGAVLVGAGLLPSDRAVKKFGDEAK